MKLTPTRTSNYIFQIKSSIVYKLPAVLATFLSIPIMIHYLSEDGFGVWVTMLTVLTWIILFDLGLGNGLKNHISQELSRGNIEEACEYINSAYIFIFILSIFICSSFFLISFYIPWQKIFNTKFYSEYELRLSIQMLSFFILLNFWMSLVNQIWHALQKSSIVVLGQLITNGSALSFVIILYYFTNPHLYYLASTYGISLVLSNLILTFLLKIRHPSLFNLFKVHINLKKLRSLFTLGWQFFIIQLAVLIVFLSDKIIISQLFGPREVTSYEVVYRLFSVVIIMHSLVLTPIWPAYTEAYQNQEWDWIKNTLLNQLKIFFGILLLIFFLVLIAPWVVSVWIDKDFVININLYFIMGLLIIVTSWNNIFAYFVNAINRVKLQVITSIIAAIINIPLSIYLASNLEMKLNGVLIATIVSLCFFAVLGPIQVFHIIKYESK